MNTVVVVVTTVYNLSPGRAKRLFPGGCSPPRRSLNSHANHLMVYTRTPLLTRSDYCSTVYIYSSDVIHLNKYNAKTSVFNI